MHRKGATPAGAGVLGIIPGSMASPGYVVRGKGSAESLNSASHGAGRMMSRTKALQSFTWSAVKKQLAAAGVELLSAGLDEVPGVYKDIERSWPRRRIWWKCSAVSTRSWSKCVHRRPRRGLRHHRSATHPSTLVRFPPSFPNSVWECLLLRNSVPMLTLARGGMSTRATELREGKPFPNESLGTRGRNPQPATRPCSRLAPVAYYVLPPPPCAPPSSFHLFPV